MFLRLVPVLFAVLAVSSGACSQGAAPAVPPSASPSIVATATPRPTPVTTPTATPIAKESPTATPELILDGLGWVASLTPTLQIKVEINSLLADRTATFRAGPGTKFYKRITPVQTFADLGLQAGDRVGFQFLASTRSADGSYLLIELRRITK